MVAVPWYLGDLVPNVPQAYYSPPAIGPILRYNINMRSSVRAHMVFYDLAGTGEIFNIPDQYFHSSFVALGLDFEFNWWPYKTASKRTKAAPYVTAGLGYGISLEGDNKSHLYLPFGGGVKVNLGKKLSGGVEVSMRKTFSDVIDDGNFVNPGDGVQTPLGNNDWYMFTGIFLTYKIFNFLDECPTYNEQTYKIKGQYRGNN